MLKTGSKVAHFSPTAASCEAPRRECVVEPPRDSTLFTILRRKISSRLARHIPLARRRLFNGRPMVTFTFDDAPVSALSIGAAMLEASGGRGTYYIASGLMGRKTQHYQVVDRDDVRNLYSSGHEIGLHGHRHSAVGRLSAQDFLDDLEQNRTQLDGIDAGIRAKNFAYPFGMAAFARKRQLSSLVHSSRSVFPGVNSGDIDPHFLKCIELTSKWLTLEKLLVHLDDVVKQNGWLIFLTHDVSASPSPYGCSPDLFRRALDGVAARGVDIVTVAEALSKSHEIGATLGWRAQ
jgi:peptidoglycan/xylan/chitin deacetylase (PgdA/CDA1 family)